MESKNRWYVVWEGRSHGVFDNWVEAKQSVKGYKGCRYKAFPSKEDAVQAFANGWEKHWGTGRVIPRETAECKRDRKAKRKLLRKEMKVQAKTKKPTSTLNATVLL